MPYATDVNGTRDAAEVTRYLNGQTRAPANSFLAKMWAQLRIERRPLSASQSTTSRRIMDQDAEREYTAHLRATTVVVLDPRNAEHPLTREERPRLTVEQKGVYVLPDGTVCKVKANMAKTGTYAYRWVVSGATRATEAGTVALGDYQYEPGLVDQVAAEGRKMTLEEAKAFMIRYGQCARCGRLLTAAVSVERGIGPVCIKYFGG